MLSVSDVHKEKGNWWFRLTAPQEPEHATFAQREATRRGRLASVTIIFISAFSCLPLFQALSQGNAGFIFTMVITLILNFIALFVFNRRGKLVVAGWFIVVVLDLGFALAFLATPGGVSFETMPAFDLMAESVLVVVAFFPPRSTFVIAFINIAFIILWIIFGPHNAAVAQMLRVNAYSVFYPPTSLELFVAILTFLWVNSATKAIADLDRSEEIVALERREIAQQEEQLVLKQQLEDGVQQLLQTHVKAANGDFSARVPLSKENILWKVAYSLNNLLSRLERYGQLQTEMIRTQEAVKLLAESMRIAKANKRPLQLPQRTGTIVDELIVELTSVAKIDVDQPKPMLSRPLPESIPQIAFHEAPNTMRRWVPASETFPSSGTRNNER